LQRVRSAMQDLRAMTAPERFLGQHGCACHRPMLERQLHRGAHVRLEQGEAREGLLEEVAQPRPTVRARRIKAADRAQALFDDGGDQAAAAGKVPIRRRTRHAGIRSNFRHRHQSALLYQAHTAIEQLPVGARAHSPGRWGRCGRRECARDFLRHAVDDSERRLLW